MTTGLRICGLKIFVTKSVMTYSLVREVYVRTVLYIHAVNIKHGDRKWRRSY